MGLDAREGCMDNLLLNEEALRRLVELCRDLDIRDMPLDRAALTRLAAVLAELDPTLSGATLILPGPAAPVHIDAQIMRRGGRA
jgi:hypothetical protein